ncbi:MAG: response regulator [Candidatus Thiocaldithrix dubininis]|uniref:histidine kinase n=1 Tax=Candidatus Thiocaldithrix dubininis TaxID=3080823 RepID=A0AA95HAG8_9GAMM|nr:MAG: response regulator [Candidatus Thiocaldithrix dubininis]
MNESNPIHARLGKQLRRIGLADNQLPSDLAQWQGLLKLVSQSYQDALDAQALLERSLEISSQEMRQLYDDLKTETEQRIDALHKSEQKNRFMANMSHELRTPIHGILGSLEIVKNTSLDERQKLFIGTAYASCEVMLDVINNILDFSKLRSGGIELHLIEFSLRELLETISTIMGTMAQEKGLDFQCFVSEMLPNRIQADPTRVRQVLMNLIGNAIKFTEQGAITVNIDVLEYVAGKALLRFEVRDTGIGIPVAMQKSIFESFVQVDASINRRYGGTGLGLTIVREFVELMGGRIGVNSEVGQGSIFWFEIPVPVMDSSHSQLQQQVTYKRALVVDDNETNRLIFESYLHALSIEAQTVSSGKTALQALEQAYTTQNGYDLVLLDWFMPQMDGISLARHIRADARFDNVPLVMITSYGLAQDKQKQLNVQAALTKPVSLVTLRDVLLDTFRRFNSRDISLKPSAIQKTVLLAEDNQVNALIAVTMLEQIKLKVEHVTTGTAVLERVKKKTYDLILMDINMPEMDGYSATEQIRQWEVEGIIRQHMPIIAMTANALSGDEERCLDSGMDDYLAKPVKQDELLRVVKQWLDIGVLKALSEPV